jgi:hypothetical protein
MGADATANTLLRCIDAGAMHDDEAVVAAIMRCPVDASATGKRR